MLLNHRWLQEDVRHILTEESGRTAAINTAIAVLKGALVKEIGIPMASRTSMGVFGVVFLIPLFFRRVAVLLASTSLVRIYVG